MPALPPSLTQTLGTLIQKTFKTNTAQEIIGDAVDLGSNRSRIYHITRLSSTVIFAGGFGTLFALEPTVSGYFMPIVQQGLPFLGPIASKVAVGFVGSWLGGAFGASAIKMIAKEVTFQSEGFRNPRLKFTKEDVKRIVENNPQYYPSSASLEENINGVTQMLIQTRNQIEFFRENQMEEDKKKYKKAFLGAINKGDLSLLAEAISATIAANATSQTMRLQTAQYSSHLGQSAPSPGLPNTTEIAELLTPPPEENKNASSSQEHNISQNRPQNAVLFSYPSQATNLRAQAQLVDVLSKPLLNILPERLAEIVGQRMSV